MMGARMQDSRNRIDIGMDVGRTKILLRAMQPEHAACIEVRGSGFNLQHIDFDEAAERLVSLLETLCTQLPHRPEEAVVCAGLAGGGIKAHRQALTKQVQMLLAERLPGIRWALDLVDDGTIALEAALGPKSGLAIIAGTGSLILGRTLDGLLTRAGGWGSLLGDEGSGYALGLEGLRVVAHAIDGGPDTQLRLLLAAHFNLSDRAALIQNVYQTQWPVQQVAPLVLEAAVEGDSVAERILYQQTAALVTQAVYLDKQHTYAPNVCLTGGLMASDVYREAIVTRLHEHLPDRLIYRAEQDPVQGALALAMSKKKLY